MKIAISAAEVSGDLIGSKLVSALQAQDNNIQIQGLVGDKMLEAGCAQLWDQKRVNVMGFSEVLKKLPALLRLRSTIIRYFSANKPDVFIGVDSPDFNFVIEKKLKQRGVKTLHFISPSVWAWRQSRIKKIKKSTDLVLCLFPFEVDFYQQHNQRAVFVGHPLAETLQPRINYQSSKNILLMPGSRESEITRLLPEMLTAAALMTEQDPELKFHLALANDELLAWVTPLAKTANVRISTSDAHQRAVQSDLVLVASGTAALELALLGVPMVVVYKLSAFSYFIASRLVKIKHISLPNIIANKNLVPELIQDDANGENIAKHALEILNSDTTILTQAFKNIHQQLNLNASEESARIIREFVNE
ncbi:Lipid-A-disaccharide synthase (EC [uncultured Gammaproteobacteria bacterium]|jgi:lipid-A-disaccharide synthase|uniref:lipid-A-disaccharide synthase n=1 Tax=thiotrophic endosymbiont of Bathymodiolus puteoserpentis (Logatchev) TaxID=343240 RepID=UPI0010BC48D0|nr:lipid-A-disaccharide synthase [thiotrophic endosymbiont of Bathymodiolus puteoserpentis (Logatchev)]CAC9577955.1 Lipid-A-disaccharide synthase (EC 2.4.1.182) [uncultured Gammaproteobacteria bacterium]SSC09522.1 Lipid-A-disaccharide synthase [thiotrophic endosymbiont of Bathymodiolus puteoserpentis (Logatchev)]VVH50469.1 Lipid-A-disaccharide synthase (EC [uncultured Gammaproteobacteria bacterium]